MSTLKHPVGPKSSNVYWRRRIIVLLGVVAVIIAVVLIIVRPGSSAGDTGSGDKTTTTTEQSDAPKDEANQTVIPTEEAAVEGKACKPANILVTAITDKDHYAPNEMPQMQLSVTNTGTKECVFDVGTSKQVFTITSGKETYWVSTHCQTGAVDAQMTLRPNVPVGSSAALTWDRTRSSAETCDTPGEPVTAGGASYHLTVAVDGVESESKQFILD